MLIAWCGFFTYGSKVDSDILTSYPVEPITTATRLFVSLLVAFSYPLQVYLLFISPILFVFNNFNFNSNIISKSLFLNQGHPSRKSILSLWEMWSPTPTSPPTPSSSASIMNTVCSRGRYVTVTVVYLFLSLIIGLTVFLFSFKNHILLLFHDSNTIFTNK